MELDKAWNNLKNVDQLSSGVSNVEHIQSNLNEETPISSEINGFTQVTAAYSGVATDNIEVIVNNSNRTISASIIQNQYASKLEFPNVGSNKLLYVDLSDNSLWRFDEPTLTYVCVGRDYNEIETINGGNA